MKTKSIPFCLATILLLAACDENRVSPVNPPQLLETDESGFLLFTDLPPEGFNGTPMPIHLRGVSPQRVAAVDARSPGTGRVFYTSSPK